MEPEEFKNKFDEIVKEHQSSKMLEDIQWLISDLEELLDNYNQ